MYAFFVKLFVISIEILVILEDKSHDIFIFLCDLMALMGDCMFIVIELEEDYRDIRHIMSILFETKSHDILTSISVYL